MNSAANLKALVLLLPMPADVLIEALFTLDEILSELRAINAELGRARYRWN